MDSFIANEAVLPEQFHPQARAQTGYHRLLLGILEQALSDLKYYECQTKTPLISTTGRSTAGGDLAELRAWFVAEANTPGSFVFICQHLEIDPHWFRRQFATCSPQSIPRRIFSHSGGYNGLKTSRWQQRS